MRINKATSLPFFFSMACLGLAGCGGGGHSASSPAPVSPAPLVSLAVLNRSGPIRIMPLGDSITYGYDDPSGDGYRKRLWDDLTGAGYTIAFSGSVSSGSPDLPDTRNEGHNGFRIDDIAAGVDGWLKNTQPSVILLMVGTNDVVQDHDLPGAPKRLSALIEQIRRDDPPAQVLVASIPPIASSFGTLEPAVEAYNAQIPALVQAKAAAGEPVTYVDIHDALTPSDLADGVHPTPAGYAKIGDAWFQALQQL